MGPMSEPSAAENEFDDQLKSLFTAAEQSIGQIVEPLPLDEGEPPTAPKAAAPKEPRRGDLEPKQALSMLQLIRPLVMGIEALTRATSENSVSLSKLQESVAEQIKLPDMLTTIQRALEQKNAINQQLFDSLHGELKSYKDNFLLDQFHKPIIRDLVTLYDDLSEIRRQNLNFEEELREGAAGDHAQREETPHGDTPEIGMALLQRMGTLNANLDHSVAALLEVMARIDVHVLPPTVGKLDKSKHRAVAVEVTEFKEEDNTIVRTVKRGFEWRERTVRPEEVIIKKWKEGFLVAIAPNSGQ